MPHKPAQDAGRVGGLVLIVRQLCALGANPNAEYRWNWHTELPRTGLWGALCAVGHPPLAEALLDAGANPTDGVSVHMAGGGDKHRRPRVARDADAVRVLLAAGADVRALDGMFAAPPLVWAVEGHGHAPPGRRSRGRRAAADRGGSPLE